MGKGKQQKPFWKKKRTEQEASISDHIGRLIDRLSLDDMIALGIGAWGAYHTNHWTGFLTGMTGYRLARSANLAAGLSGISMLAFTGLFPYIHPLLADAQKRALEGIEEMRKAGMSEAEINEAIRAMAGVT